MTAKLQRTSNSRETGEINTRRFAALPAISVSRNIYIYIFVTRKKGTRATLEKDEETLKVARFFSPKERNHFFVEIRRWGGLGYERGGKDGGRMRKRDGDGKTQRREERGREGGRMERQLARSFLFPAGRRKRLSSVSVHLRTAPT